MKEICNVCGNSPIDTFSSTHTYWCFHCKKFYPWPLDYGQKSILIHGLIGGQENGCSRKKTKESK